MTHLLINSHLWRTLSRIIVITHCISGVMSQAPLSSQSDNIVNPVNKSTETSPFAPTQSQSNTTSNSSDFVRHTKFVLPNQPINATSRMDLAGRQINPASVEAISQLQFVRTNGVYFTVGGRIRYFKGSNDYFLVLR